MSKIRKIDNTMFDPSRCDLYQLVYSFPSAFGDDYQHLEFYSPFCFFDEEHAFLYFADKVKDYFKRVNADGTMLPYSASMFHFGTFDTHTGKIDAFETKFKQEIPIYSEGVFIDYETFKEK